MKHPKSEARYRKGMAVPFMGEFNGRPILVIPCHSPDKSRARRWMITPSCSVCGKDVHVYYDLRYNWNGLCGDCWAMCRLAGLTPEEYIAVKNTSGG